MLHSPVPNLFEIPAGVGRPEVAEHLFLFRAPLPVNSAGVRCALQGLPKLIVAVLHVVNVVFCLVRPRREIHGENSRVGELAHQVQTMQLVENVKLDHELRGIAGKRCCCVWQMSCGLSGYL